MAGNMSRRAITLCVDASGDAQSALTAAVLCSNLMWSYGKLGTTHEALMEALDHRTLQLLPSLQPQSVVRALRS